MKSGRRLFKANKIRRARKFFQFACNFGHAKGCVELEHLEKRAGNSEARKIAAEKGCNLNDMGKCELLSRLLIIRGRLKKAKHYLGKACFADPARLHACDLLGEIEGRGGDSDLSRRAYERGCRAANSHPCDGKMAFQLLRYGCYIGHAATCLELGRRLRDEQPAGAVAAFKTACQKGLNEACSEAEVTAGNVAIGKTTSVSGSSTQ